VIGEVIAKYRIIEEIGHGSMGVVYKVRRRHLAPVSEDMATQATFVTMPGTILGTYAYMAPEQVRGEAVDGRADLYSLGVVLYEMSTGTFPVRGRPMATLPGGLAPVIARLIAPDRNARYRNAAEVREAFEKLKPNIV
jgi:serine/threonine protein kinase